MKKLLALLFVAAAAAFAQAPSCTQVVGPFYTDSPTGPVLMPTGSQVQTILNYTSALGGADVGNSNVVNPITAGQPNAPTNYICLTPGNWTAIWSVGGSNPPPPFRRTWIIPATGGPYTRLQVETTSPVTPTTAVVLPSQITPGTSGQVLTTVAGVSTWAPAASGSGTVTSLTFAAPLTGGTITTSGTVGITQATTSTDGYLSSTNWNTFNGKLGATSAAVIATFTGCSGTQYLGADGACHAVSSAFSAITSGTNTNAAMVVGTGASLGTSGNATGATGDIQATETDVFITNDAITGTNQNLLASILLASSPATVNTVQALTQTPTALGVCVAGCGTTGKAQIRISGVGSCQFDGATTIGDYVINSATNKGYCHDAGASPGNYVQTSFPIIGRVLSTNASAGVYSIIINRTPQTVLKVGTYAQIIAVAACNAANLSATAYITDSATTVLGAVISVGGGTNFVHMACMLQGASYNWIVGEGAESVAISQVGTAGLSGTPPVTISAAGAIGCATCLTANQSITLSGDTTGSGTTAITTTTAKVNGVSYGTSPSTNTVPVVTGTNTVTYEAVPNAALANSSLTVGSTSPLTGGGSVSLGGAVTLACGGCVTASSPGVGIAHFAGSTQAVTSSAVDLSGADATGVLAAGREPAHTGDMTNSAGSLTTVVGAVNGVTYPASPTVGTSPVVTAANTVTYRTPLAFPNALNGGAVVVANFNSASAGVNTIGSSVGASCTGSLWISYWPKAGYFRGTAIATRGTNGFGTLRANVDPDCTGTVGASNGPVAGGAIVTPGAAAGGFADTTGFGYHTLAGSMNALGWTLSGSTATAPTVNAVATEFVDDAGTFSTPLMGGINGTPGASATNYINVWGSGFNATEKTLAVPIPVNGTLSTLFTCQSATVVPNTITWTINKNTVAGTQTTTHSTSDSTRLCHTDTVDTTSVVAGDYFDFAVTTGSGTQPGFPAIGVVFTPSSGSATLIGGIIATTVTTTLTYNTPMTTSASTTIANQELSMPRACTIGNLYVMQATANGAGVTTTFTIYKNGAPTAITGTITSATSITTGVPVDTTHTVSYSPPDLITLGYSTASGTSGTMGGWSATCT